MASYPCSTGSLNPIDTAYDEGRVFRAFYGFSGDTVIKVQSLENIDLTSARQDVNDGDMRYRVFLGGSDATAFTVDIPTFGLNLKEGVPVLNSQVIAKTGGTVDLTGATQIAESRIKTSNASGQRESIANSQLSVRGFPPGVFYIVIDTIPGDIGSPEGLLEFEWIIK